MAFVGMMHQCSTGELLARAVFMHHDEEGHAALMHDAVFKGLKLMNACETPASPASCHVIK